MIERLFNSQNCVFKIIYFFPVLIAPIAFATISLYEGKEKFEYNCHVKFKEPKEFSCACITGVLEVLLYNTTNICMQSVSSWRIFSGENCDESRTFGGEYYCTDSLELENISHSENAQELILLYNHHKDCIVRLTLVASERKANMDVLRTKQQGRISWNAYYSYADIMEWVDELPALYPDLVTVSSIGNSFEGRAMKVVKVSKNSARAKVSMFFDGGFHAREWISPATVTYFLNEILTKQDEYSDILDAIDFHIVPIVNVDGYEFSRDQTRMWRKTRSNHNSTCRGVDPNRNFNYHFGESGTSNDRCSDIYRGPEPFSEIEAANLRDYILGLRDNEQVNWQVYVTVHSYGQYILIPWSYIRNSYPEDFDEMLSLAEGGADALTAVHGTRYTVGQSANTLGATAGCSDDWAKSEGIKYAYTYELRDTGRYGFVLPPEYIIPVAEETVVGFKHLCNNYVASSAAKSK